MKDSPPPSSLPQRIDVNSSMKLTKQAKALFKSLIDNSNPGKKKKQEEFFHHDVQINEHPEDLSQYFSAVQGDYMM